MMDDHFSGYADFRPITVRGCTVMTVTKPVRIQRKRTKGWRMPENTVSVTRPSILGNPFTIAQALESGYVETEEEARTFVVECLRDWLVGGRQGRDWWQGPESDRRRAAILARLPEMRGKNLACWCPLGSPCHADVLLELANEGRF